MYGFNGRIHVTLPDRIREDKLSDYTAKKLLGGRGLSAYILYNCLKANVDPLGQRTRSYSPWVHSRIIDLNIKRGRAEVDVRSMHSNSAISTFLVIRRVGYRLQRSSSPHRPDSDIGEEPLPRYTPWCLDRS